MTMDLSLQILPLTMTHDDLYEALRNESPIIQSENRHK